MRCAGSRSSPRTDAAARQSGGCSGSGRQRRASRREIRNPVECRPVDQLDAPVMMFDERGATFHPVAIVQIKYAVYHPHLSMMNMAAYHAVEPAATCLVRKRRLEAIYRLHGPLDL